MTISGKMMTGFTLVIAIMALANGYVLFELHSVSERGRSTLTSDVQAIDRAKYLKGLLFDQQRDGRKYLVSGDDAYFGLFADDLRRFSRNLDSLASIPQGPLRESLIATIREQHQILESTMTGTEEASQQSERREPATVLGESMASLHELLDRFIVLNQLSIDRSMAVVERTTQRSEQVASIMLLSAVILALGAALVIASTITRPIRTLIKGTVEIAKGSFEPVEVSSRDEISLLARAVNEMSAKLKQSEEKRREMMQHIAHELRTPLSTMMTAHYVLTQQRVGPVNAEQLRLLAAIRKNIDRLTDFSYDFLDLAKIEAGMMQYTLERTDLVSFIEPLVEEARLSASQKEISILFDSMATPDVLIDRKRFSQVVTNLLSNAIKYSETGGKVVVSVLPVDHGARITVADNGPGIAPEDLRKVFEKFFRVRSSDGKGTRGTGVGLALVKAVTEALGGSVSAESRLQEGSTFIVTLPTAPPEVEGIPKFRDVARVGHG
jgi:signal transduction histidine kinase